MKLAVIALLVHPLLILGPSGLFAATDWGAKAESNPGPHGFSQIVYQSPAMAAWGCRGAEEQQVHRRPLIRPFHFSNCFACSATEVTTSSPPSTPRTPEKNDPSALFP